MIQLKDYLHLYPRVPIVIFEFGCEPVSHYLEGIDWCDDSVIAERVRYHWNQIKPILHPLTSLTEKDCLIIAKLATDNVVEEISRIDCNKQIQRVEIFCDNDTEKVDIRPNLIEWVEWHEKVPKSGVIADSGGSWNTLSIHNYAKIVKFLLDKRIDIFGLIKEDLAIDSSTLAISEEEVYEILEDDLESPEAKAIHNSIINLAKSFPKKGKTRQ